MEIHMNITFPKLPCELLTLDVMDVSGEQQHGVLAGVRKIRLEPTSQGGGVIDMKRLALHDDADSAIHLDPDYCGQCYGAPAPPNAQKAGCCNTCDDVREAYAQASWAFGKGEGVEQCQREHYAEKLEEQRHEGCRIAGAIRVNKVVGNFHFAPGRSFSNGNMHVHDLKNYWESPVKHSFEHEIHQLRFGPQLPEDLSSKHAKSGLYTNHHMNPLDEVKQDTDDPNFNFMYFIKVVPTSYLPLNKKRAVTSGYNRAEDDTVWLGSLGDAFDGSMETHQYSVTSHKRSLSGGNDAADGHQERMHARGGIPGVFFSYDISPMKVVNREERAKSFSGFLTGLCAVIGGTLTVAAAVDRAVFEGATRLRKLQSKNL